MKGHRLTLRQLLTVPYVMLVLLSAALIGVLSYRAGGEAVDTLSDLMLNETVGRISQAVDRHIAGSEAVVHTKYLVLIDTLDNSFIRPVTFRA